MDGKKHQEDESSRTILYRFQSHPYSRPISLFLLLAFVATIAFAATFHSNAYLPALQFNPPPLMTSNCNSVPVANSTQVAKVPNKTVAERPKLIDITSSSDSDRFDRERGRSSKHGFKELIVDPLPVIHSMTDEELLWMASLSAKVSKYPYPRVPKVAFMFLTRGPLPLAPLWEKFFKGGDDARYSIYVHAHPSYTERVSEQSAFYGRRIPSKAVGWGQISQTEALRRLLANALLDFSNEWFAMLTESCIPIAPFNTVYDYLMSSNLSFINIEEPSDSANSRYNGNMAPVLTLQEWRKGSTWFQANRRVAVELVSDETYFPLFAKYTRIPDEHYFHTLIHIKFAGWNSNRSLTYVDWSNHGLHPESFGGSDVTVELLRKMRVGEGCDHKGQKEPICNLFARKFRPDSLDKLLSLSSEGLGY